MESLMERQKASRMERPMGQRMVQLKVSQTVPQRGRRTAQRMVLPRARRTAGVAGRPVAAEAAPQAAPRAAMRVAAGVGVETALAEVETALAEVVMEAVLVVAVLVVVVQEEERKVVAVGVLDAHGAAVVGGLAVVATAGTG